MLLSLLLQRLDVVQISGPTARVIRGVTHDSRQVQEGWLYAAIPGERVDGHRFVEGLGQAGAVLVERQVPAPEGVTVVQVRDARAALAQVAAAFYRRPAETLRVIGVTGTNGKTTTTTLIDQALGLLGRRAGRVGTMGTWLAGTAIPTQLTTPESHQLQGLFREALDLGVEVVAMEVSSIGLVQRRVDAIPFYLGIFTSLGRDHLDFHGTMDAYLDAKAGLFRAHLRAEGGAPRALVVDEAPLDRLSLPQDTWRYGFDQGSELSIRALSLGPHGLSMTVHTPAGPVRLSSPLVGRYNAMNLTAALGALLTLGVGLEEAASALGQVRGVEGRLESVDNRGGAAVLVDYAHTEDALEAAIGAVREVTPGAVWVVFGCGGDRDQGKRPRMGEVVSRLADHQVVTSDNPRSEDPLQIIEAILSGMSGTPAVEPDRAAAIRLALRGAGEGDAVLIAGKGHETYQEIGGVRYPFDDREVAARVLRDLQGRIDEVQR
ncbi:MAG: UDP-N-acetylmuramoyl-L-alanyl-D-glutamate--2,6-diaminopimelate ligase [Deltaproteobacteria bacterium]|nr:UDP-N-acetylmuramoyl-L-alanyl-D-glutamate--2,6-diaminopimelate ligase [Deltaproteobacteria bacterium]